MPTITLNPSWETYVNKEAPDKTHNGNNFLRCGYGSASDKCYYTYLNFPIHANIPKGSTITSAKLSLYSYSNDCWQAETTLICKRVTSTWSTSTLTWNNKPTATDTNSVTGTFSGYSTWYTFTITKMVQDALDASSNYGFVVRQNTSTLSKAKCFRKNTTDYEPKLEITYTEPSIKITFYGNGATGVGSNSSATSYNPTSNLTQTVKYSGSYDSFDLYNVGSLFAKTGYTRKSSAEAWRVGSASATTYMPDTEADFTTYINKAHSLDNKLSLYANWVGNTYYVTYDANGGTGAPGKTSYTYTTSTTATVTLSSTKPTKASESVTGYTVTLNANGGTCDKASVTAARTKKYTFSSWNTVAGGTGTSYSAGGSFPRNVLNGDTLYAQYTSTTTTSAVTLPTPTRTGYKFKGWGTTSTATSFVSTSYTPTKSLTLYAIWEAKKLTITYYRNTSSTDTVTTTQTYTYGASNNIFGNSTTDSWTKSGYSQSKWTSAKDGTGTSWTINNEVTNDRINNNADSGLSVYLQWSENYIEIRYYPNGASQSDTQASSYPLTSGYWSYKYYYDNDYSENGLSNINTLFITPTGKHYTAASAWNTASDGSGTNITHNADSSLSTGKKIAEKFGKSIVSSSISGTNAIKLYANWQLNILKIRYNANGGSQEGSGASEKPMPWVDNYNAVYGGNYNGTNGLVDISTFGLTKTGYSTEPASAWYATVNGSKITLPSNTTYTVVNLAKALGVESSLNTTASTTVDVYANWKANTYNVYYNANGGSGAPEKTSYTYATSGTVSLSSTKPTKSNTPMEGYTVTLVANGGLLNTTSLVVERTMKYTFNKWTTQSDGTGTSYNSGGNFPKSIANDTELYAQYTGTSSTSSVSLPVPTKEDYIFKGWGIAEDSISGITGTYTPTSSITLYAIWELSLTNFTISFNSNGGTAENLANYTQTFNYGDSAQINIPKPENVKLKLFGKTPIRNAEWYLLENDFKIGVNDSFTSDQLEEIAQNNNDQLVFYVNWRNAGRVAYFISSSKKQFIFLRKFDGTEWKRGMMYVCTGKKENGEANWQPTIEPLTTLQTYQILYPDVFPAGDNQNIYTLSTIDEFYPTN